MGHYAKVINGIVDKVIVAEADFFDTYVDESAGDWIQTSYNTNAGVHINGLTPLRKNYACIGFTYDATRDAFIPPKPFNSWTLDEATCIWQPPVVYPDDGNRYDWNEETMSWNVVKD